jgi:hypothetical protein
MKGMLKAVTIFLFFFSIVMTLLYIDSRNNTEKAINEKDSLQKANDSLNAELFPCEIELNRYKIAYEIFLRRNHKAATQYGNIISDETE